MTRPIKRRPIKTMRVRLREWKRAENIKTTMTQLIQMLMGLTVAQLCRFWGLVAKFPDCAEGYLTRRSRDD